MCKFTSYIKFIFILFVLIAFNSNSQVNRIEGIAYDTTEQISIKNAKVILINLLDSMIIQHKTTDQEGKFILENFALDTFRLIIDHPKYETREFYFFGDNDKQEYKLDKIILSHKGKKMEEVTVFAFKDPIYYRGDTLVYVADSFKTRQNAVVEDLLKKLPGITIEADGKIKSQGKEVARVFVDGDEFFGSDATLATKNLAASSIKTVEVYETNLPDGNSSDQKVQVLDLKLKDEAKKGYFGKTSFGTDFSRFYEGQFLINKFNKKQKISAYLLSGNTTRSALDWEDAYDYGINEGGAYSYNSETDSWEANDNFISTSEGFPQTLKTGLYFNDQVTEKLKIGANYTFSDLRKQTKTNSKTVFYLPDTTYSTTNENTVKTRFIHHEANFNFKYDIDSSQTIEFIPKINFSTRNDEENSVADFFNQNNVQNRNSFTSNITDNDALNIKAKLGYTKRFKKDKRQLSVFNNIILDNSTGESSLLFNDVFTQSNSLVSRIDQNKNSKRAIYSNVFNVIFTEPITKKIKLEFMYELFNSTNTQNTRSYDLDNFIHDKLDSLTSGDFKSIKFQNRVSTSIIYDFKKHFLSIGAAARNVNIDNQNHFLGTAINQNENAILPFFNYRFKISRSSNLNFRTHTTSTLPSIALLQPIRDNSNPNSISIGNINLKPNYTLNSNLTYNNYNSVSGSYFYANLYANYGLNQFVSALTYDTIGRVINSYRNDNTLNYLGVYSSGSIPIVKQILDLQPTINYSYGNRFSYVNSERNALNTHSLKSTLGIRLMMEIVEFSIRSNYELIKNFNSISSNLDLTNNIFGLSSDLVVYLPWKMELSSEFEYLKYNNLNEGFNVNTFIWNAGLKQNIGKNDQFGIALNTYDILNQNTKIGRSAFANSVTDSRRLVISRYFMFSVTYKFNSTFKKSKDTNVEE